MSYDLIIDIDDSNIFDNCIPSWKHFLTTKGCAGRLEINKSLNEYNAMYNGTNVVKFKTELDAIRWKMDWLS